jgi:hypothetical protein
MSWWKPHYFWSVIAMIALIIIGFVVWSNWRQMQADAAATAATGMMRLGMVPEPVRAPMPEWDTTIEKVPPLPLDLSANALEKQRARMEKGPCGDWRNCINGFPEDRYGRN